MSTWWGVQVGALLAFLVVFVVAWIWHAVAGYEEGHVADRVGSFGFKAVLATAAVMSVSAIVDRIV